MRFHHCHSRSNRKKNVISSFFYYFYHWPSQFSLVVWALVSLAGLILPGLAWVSVKRPCQYQILPDRYKFSWHCQVWPDLCDYAWKLNHHQNLPDWYEFPWNGKAWLGYVILVVNFQIMRFTLASRSFIELERVWGNYFLGFAWPALNSGDLPTILKQSLLRVWSRPDKIWQC